MRILCAPNAFKGTLTAAEICATTQLILTQHTVTAKPLADGGDGTLDVLKVAIPESQEMYFEVTGALPDTKVKAPLLWIPEQSTACIEMARVCGLAMLKPEQRNPGITTTRGLGELITEGIKLGARKIILGIGGSATNDAGTGALSALGWKFLDQNSNELPPGGAALSKLAEIKKGPELSVECEVLCDVANPLLGPNGASYIYGPQKGADTAMVKELDAALTRLQQLVMQQFSQDIDIPGGGAAGGVGSGAVFGLNASLVPGFTALANLVSLEKAVQESDLVITGEGRLDQQTLSGKVVAGVLALAKKYEKPVILLVGSSEIHDFEPGIELVELVGPDISLEKALSDPAGALKARLSGSISTLLLSK